MLKPWLQLRARMFPNGDLITLRLTPDSKAPVIQVGSGDGGRPDLRTQITLDQADGHPSLVEPFSSYNRGRRLRMWARFTHTGEAGDIAGETVALITSLGAAVLMVTGFSLSIRRLSSRMRRG